MLDEVGRSAKCEMKLNEFTVEKAIGTIKIEIEYYSSKYEYNYPQLSYKKLGIQIDLARFGLKWVEDYRKEIKSPSVLSGLDYSGKKQSFTLGQLFNTSTLWIVLTILLGGMLMITIIDKQQTRISKNEFFINKRSDNPLIEVKVFEKASEFKCGCGSCGVLPLYEGKCDFEVNE